MTWLLYGTVAIFWGCVVGIPAGLIVHAYRLERRS